MPKGRPYSFEKASKLLQDIVIDLSILSGDTVGPSNSSWQDVAGTCMTNLRVLASQFEEARKGNVRNNAPVVFPSLSEVLEDL